MVVRLPKSGCTPGKVRAAEGNRELRLGPKTFKDLHYLTIPELKPFRNHSGTFQLSSLGQVENVQLNSQQNIDLLQGQGSQQQKSPKRSPVIYFI